MLSLQFFQKVGAQAARALKALLVAPFINLGLMAGKEYAGNLPPVIICRTSVNRGRKQIILK